LPPAGGSANSRPVSEARSSVLYQPILLYSSDHILPSFLAKNESTKQRWTHKTIKPLILNDGSTGKLCRYFLNEFTGQRTKQITCGKLLLHPVSQKPLTVHQLSTQVCKLILRADPSSRAKVHDVRKYAASCCLAETMDVSDMVTALQWSSESTFFKYYLAPTAPLSVPVILPGTSRTEHTSMAITTLVSTHEELITE